MEIGAIDDWLQRDKENSKEYRNSRYKKQTLPRGLGGERVPKKEMNLEIGPFLQGQDSGLSGEGTTMAHRMVEMFIEGLHWKTENLFLGIPGEEPWRDTTCCWPQCTAEGCQERWYTETKNCFSSRFSLESSAIKLIILLASKGEIFYYDKYSHREWL